MHRFVTKPLVAGPVPLDPLARQTREGRSLELPGNIRLVDNLSTFIITSRPILIVLLLSVTLCQRLKSFRSIDGLIVSLFIH